MCKHHNGAYLDTPFYYSFFLILTSYVLVYGAYLPFRNDLLETGEIILLNCKTGKHQVHLVMINTVSFDHVMWKCVSPEEFTEASSLSRNY